MAHARSRRGSAELRGRPGRGALRAERQRHRVQDRTPLTDEETMSAAGTALPAAAELQALASRIPAGVCFGASSWNYPGWRNLVYHREYETRGAPARMLSEYAAFPLFRTVGIDSSFYAPPLE